MGAGRGPVHVIPCGGVLTPGIPTAYDAISISSLTTNLKLCLDFEDGASYPGSGQNVLDRSGGGYDFFLGTTSGSESTDPTVAGGYATFDGADCLKYDQGSNETWQNAPHKDNALVSAVVAVYLGSVAGTQAFVGTSDDSESNVGIVYGAIGGRQFFSVHNGIGTAMYAQTSNTITAGAWNIFGLTMNEAVGAAGSFFVRNGATHSTSANHFSGYSGPSSSAASHVMRIGDAGNGARRLASGSRLGFIAIWQGTALTLANHTAIYDLVKGRFGLS